MYLNEQLILDNLRKCLTAARESPEALRKAVEEVTAPKAVEAPQLWQGDDPPPAWAVKLLREAKDRGELK